MQNATLNTTDQALTTNGALTNATSLNANVDLFFAIGASRGVDITPAFLKAYSENPEAAIRILLWSRDVRGGSGERQTFRDQLKTIAEVDLDIAKRVLNKIPELGRWDDVLSVFGTPLEKEALRLVRKGLRSKNRLCAKWMPRKGNVANAIRSYMRMSPKTYRTTLVELTKVVEQDMCGGTWNQISYGKLPSIASARYQKAFYRHDSERYQKYREALQQGTENINANAIFPHDVVKAALCGDDVVATSQWKALPDYLDEYSGSILPVVDVSGSMNSGGGSVRPIDVAVALGLYLSERNTGHFHNTFLTFSENPSAVVVDENKSLGEKISSMMRAGWGFSTNLMSVFNLILTSAIRHNLPNDEMPSTLIILSDMEFDTCIKDGQSVTAIEAIRSKYEKANYQLPNVVFWNISNSDFGRVSNVPVRCNEIGTVLISGYSPSIMRVLVNNLSDVSKLTPENLMIETIIDERYNF